MHRRGEGSGGSGNRVGGWGGGGLEEGRRPLVWLLLCKFRSFCVSNSFLANAFVSSRFIRYRLDFNEC